MHRNFLKYKIYYITTNWYAPVCTSMRSNFLKYKIYYITTNFYALVCTSMRRYAPRSYEIGNTGLKHTSCSVKTVKMTTVCTKPFELRNI